MRKEVHLAATQPRQITFGGRAKPRYASDDFDFTCKSVHMPRRLRTPRAPRAPLDDGSVYGPVESGALRIEAGGVWLSGPGAPATV